MSEPSYLSRENQPKLAYRYTPATAGGKQYPLVMFLGGFKSDMNGTKASYLEEQCKARGQGYLRFDYSGHGLSDGQFEDGTIGSWKDDALAVFDHIVKAPVILVGSSMGGWIGLMVLLARSDLIHGMVGIAAAPDFTEDMYHNYLTDEQKCEIEEKGSTELPNDYDDEPYIITKALIEDGKEQCLLGQEHHTGAPIRLIQGMEDKEVPWKTALRIEKAFTGAEVDVVLVDDGDHSLSRPDDLVLIDKEIQSLSGILMPMEKSA